ncbi:hypothetical protein EYZ11_007705 [Aspergillus tanneri]|uniref:ZZ-type domain-containing protein n=1 Tax=Aspergillus tanneri TaxID=1220188 RepID=A0A4S3JC98_9EURO|nr:hypothetical protein EYZ11_007705 [Aspergillus tanneri]
MEYSQPDLPSAQDLLQSGEPFVPFSEFSVHTIQDLLAEDASGWVQRKLDEGIPFVIRGFDQLDSWDRSILSNQSLVTFSSSEGHARPSNAKESLYAKDLHCPSEWIRALEAVVPSSLRYLGSLDLFRVLPKGIAPEVLMAYVGTRKSFGTVALNLMVETEGKGSGPGALCFGTDTNSRAKYDVYMEEMEKAPHIDWANISTSQLKSADFPIYVTHQGPGDLVVFPSATAHQIWNISSLVTKVVWNIMHTSSVMSFFDYVQPVYQMQCHADTGRVPLIPVHALSHKLGVEESRVLLEIFQRLVDDEDIGQNPNVLIKLVDTQGAVVECNFCGLTIWNRHLHCEQCGDFDLCLACFVSGRSCKHTGDYAWAEIFPRQRCQEIIKTTRERIGYRPTSKSSISTRKSLGILAVSAAEARQQPLERLCHLCRDSHPVWKGVTCSQCTAFFCLRGLHRHFDIDLLAFLRNEGVWNCPKCAQQCNCRCCHFSRPYQSKDKPVRARIKPVDSRGRIHGFVDNVFDQKRGKKASQPLHSGSLSAEIIPRSQKRARVSDGDEQAKLWHRDSPSHLGNRPSEAPSAFSTDMAPSSRTGSLGPKAQLRISDLVEDRTSPIEASATSHGRTGMLPIPPIYSMSHLGSTSHDPGGSSHEYDSHVTESSSSRNGDNIASLEKKCDSLRQYADDLLELRLVESHAALLDRIGQLEAEIERRKRRKAEMLFDNLHRDFPELANMAREEAQRRGI